MLNRPSTMKRSKVGISRSEYNSVCHDLEKALQAFGFSLKGRNDVVIKINLSDFRPPETGAITHPLFLNALLKYLRTSHSLNRIFIIESDSVFGLPDHFLKWFGFLPILEEWDAEFVNLSKCITVIRRIDGFHLKKIRVAEFFLEDPFFISLAKLKTSNITKITCSLKNQFGCLPRRWKSRYHPVIDEVIADVNLALRPNFSIVDGIIGLGGAQGPSFGSPVQSNVFLYGDDPVAIDSVCAKIIGFRYTDISHIKKAAELGVGSPRYEVFGIDLKAVMNDVELRDYFNKLEFYSLKVGSWLQKIASTGT